MSYSAYIFFFFHLIEYPTIAKLYSYDSISSYKNESSRIYRYINTINIIFVSFWFTIQVFHSGTQWWRFRISREMIRIGLFGQKQGGEEGGRERKRRKGRWWKKMKLSGMWHDPRCLFHDWISRSNFLTRF